MTGDGGAKPQSFYDRSCGITITEGGEVGEAFPWGFWSRDGDDDSEGHMYRIEGPRIMVSQAASTDEYMEVWQAIVSALAEWRREAG